MTQDKEDLAKWIVGELKESKMKSSSWRKQARECYDFYSSNQWSDEDAAKLDEEGRPAVVFNRITRTINAIAGLEVQNRQEVRFIPRETNDGAVNDILTAAAKWVRDNCDAEDEESEAFQDALISGVGAIDTSLDYEIDQDGKIIIERGDPLEFYWDFRSKKRNMDDTRWRARVISMSDKDVKDKWPEWESGKSGEQWLDIENEPTDVTPPRYQGDGTDKGGKKPIEVVKFQWYEKESFHRIASDGKIIELSDTKFTRMRQTIDEMGLQHVSQIRRKYQVAYLIGDEIVEQRDLEVQNGFTINFITGLRDRNNNSWFGLVNLMLDPQRWANKWLSQTMHILNSNSKGGLMAEEGSFKNPRKAEEEWADPAAITWLNSGGLQKVQQKQVSQLPSGIEGLMKYALESINDVPGVNSELLGLADRQQAGILETTRKQAGITMLALFFDALRRYRKEQGRILARFIVDYIADGRMIRIVGEQGAQAIPLLRDPLTFEYDVVVDDSPTSPNQKERVAAILQAMLPNMMKMGVPFIPEVLDYLPLPEPMIQKWKQAMPQQNNPQMAQMQQAMQMQHEQALQAVQVLQGQIQKQQQALEQLQQTKQYQDMLQKIKQADDVLKEQAVSLDKQAADLKYREDMMGKSEQLARETLKSELVMEEAKREKTIADIKLIVAAVEQKIQQVNTSETQPEEPAQDQPDMMALHCEMMSQMQQAIAAISQPRIKTAEVVAPSGQVYKMESVEAVR